MNLFFKFGIGFFSATLSFAPSFLKKSFAADEIGTGI